MVKENWTKARLNVFLMALLGSEALVDAWWVCPNKAFEMDTPDYVYEQYPEHVVKYILRQSTY
jgi:hypothetical protein